MTVPVPSAAITAAKARLRKLWGDQAPLFVVDEALEAASEAIRADERDRILPAVREVTRAYQAMIHSPRVTGSGDEWIALREAMAMLADLLGDATTPATEGSPA